MASVTEFDRLQDAIDALLGSIRGGWSDIVTKPFPAEARARECEKIADYEAELLELLEKRAELRGAGTPAGAD